MSERLRDAHLNWVRPTVIGIAGTVVGGIVLYLILAGGGSGTPQGAATSTAATTPLPIETVSILQARDVTKRRHFVETRVPVDPGDRVQFRVRLHNTSDHDIAGVAIAPNFSQSTLVYATVDVRETKDGVEQTIAPNLTLTFDPTNGVGGASLDFKSYRLFDSNLHLVRKLAPEIFRNGGVSNDIKVGTLKAGQTVYVGFSASIGRFDVSPGQLTGGPLLAARDANGDRKAWKEVNIVARDGETLYVDLMLHDPFTGAVIEPFVREQVLPLTSSTFKRVTARITTSNIGSIPATSDPLIINFEGDKQGTLTYVPGSTKAYHCVNSSCTKWRSVPLPDGILQGGIVVAKQIGGDRRGPHVAPSSLIYVRFSLRAAIP